MLEVLIYLFESCLQPQLCPAINTKQLTEKLLLAGFNTSDVERAISWIGRLSIPEEMPLLSHLDAARLYTDEECKMLGMEGRQFLYRLENSKLLHPWTRELVVKRAIELDGGPLSLEVIKWLVFMVSLHLSDEYEVDLQSLAAVLFEAHFEPCTEEPL